MLIPDQIYLIIMSIFIIQAHLFVSRKQMLSNFANYKRRGEPWNSEKTFYLSEKTPNLRGGFWKLLYAYKKSMFNGGV